jgi:iron complex outermembrane receptor protein
MRVDPVTTRDNPQNQFNLRSYVDLTKDLEFNGALYYVEQTSHTGGIVPLTTPSYVRLDLGLTWRPTKSIELSLWGQNLLDNRHSEFFSFHTQFLTEVPRGMFGKISWRF